MKFLKQSTILSFAVLLLLVGDAFSQTTTTLPECERPDTEFDGCPYDDPSGHPSFFPYPYDCTKFIVCTNGQPKVECCPTGTRWDQNLTTCNHDNVVECHQVTNSPGTGVNRLK